MVMAVMIGMVVLRVGCFGRATAFALAVVDAF